MIKKIVDECAESTCFMAFYVAATFLTPRLKLGIEFVLDDGAGISSGGEQLASYSPPFTGNFFGYQRYS